MLAQVHDGTMAHAQMRSLCGDISMVQQSGFGYMTKSNAIELCGLVQTKFMAMEQWTVYEDNSRRNQQTVKQYYNALQYDAKLHKSKLAQLQN